MVRWCKVKLTVPKRPNNLDNSNSGDWVYSTSSGCRWCCLDIVFSRLSFLSSSLSLGDGPIQTGILYQRAVKP